MLTETCYMAGQDISNLDGMLACAARTTTRNLVYGERILEYKEEDIESVVNSSCFAGMPRDVDDNWEFSAQCPGKRSPEM